MKQFRKKPVVIEAEQFLPGETPWPPGVTEDPKSPTGFSIGTLENTAQGHEVTPGDWIIRGVNGELYPCKPDIFTKTYDDEAVGGKFDRKKELADLTAAVESSVGKVRSQIDAEEQGVLDLITLGLHIVLRLTTATEAIADTLSTMAERQGVLDRISGSIEDIAVDMKKLAQRHAPDLG